MLGRNEEGGPQCQEPIHRIRQSIGGELAPSWWTPGLGSHFSPLSSFEFIWAQVAERGAPPRALPSGRGPDGANRQPPPHSAMDAAVPDEGLAAVGRDPEGEADNFAVAYEDLARSWSLCRPYKPLREPARHVCLHVCGGPDLAVLDSGREKRNPFASR